MPVAQTIKYTLRIPDYRPPSLNEITRGKRRRGIDLCLEAAEMIGGYAISQRIPKATGMRRVSVRVVYGPGQRMHDVDAFQKATLDSLVACGQLVNDNYLYCRLGHWEYERGTETSTEITLEELS